MAAPTHAREPEPEETQISPWGKGSPPSGEACLALRMWHGAGTAEAVALDWDGEDPAISLALDLITASAGTLVTSRNGILIANLPSIQAAVLAARRLQWAIQGFSENLNQRAISLAVLVHSSEDLLGHPEGGELLHAFEQASPGQILLTQKVSQSFENLPGYPMMAAAAAALKELLWRGPDEQSTRSFDEQILAQFIEEQGGQEHLAEEPLHLAAPQAIVQAPVAAASPQEPHSEAPRGKSHALGISLGLAAVAIAAAAIFYFTRGTSSPAPEQNQPAVQSQPTTTTPPSADTGAPAARADQTAPARTNNQKEDRKGKKGKEERPKTEDQSKAVSPPAARPEPPTASHANCDLDSSQISGQILQAEKNLGRGKYGDAQRELSAVLACEPGNGRARDDLDRVRRAILASQSEN